MHFLYFFHARKLYVRAYVNITRQWKSTRATFTCVSVKVAGGSTSTLDPPYIASMIITRVNEIEAMYEVQLTYV